MGKRDKLHLWDLEQEENGRATGRLLEDPRMRQQWPGLKWQLWKQKGREQVQENFQRSK